MKFNFLIAAVDSPSAIYFTNVNAFCEKFVKYALICVLGVFTTSSIIFAAIGAGYYYIKDGYIEAHNLFLPYKLR